VRAGDTKKVPKGTAWWFRGKTVAQEENGTARKGKKEKT